MPLDLPPFRPHPLVRGGHLQTIIGSAWKDHRESHGVEHRVQLPDGDAIVLHDDGPEPRADDSAGALSVRSQPIALLLHGLGGCHQSGYVVRSSAKLRTRGIRVFRMNLRGCGAGLALARHPVHAGRSDDARAALDYLAEHCPYAPVHLIGFSLGGNIVLKLAGEAGGQVPKNLASVLAVAPPIDLLACAYYLQRGLNRFYDGLFLKGLFKHVRERTAAVPDALLRPLVPRPRSVMEFDDIFTAPLSGFTDANDYYVRSSCKPLLSKIAVPTLIITAASDPIVPIVSYEEADLSLTTQLVVTPCGGHLGYLGRGGCDPDRRWLDWRIVDWVVAQSAAVLSPVAAVTTPR